MKGESASTTIKNIDLVMGACFALVLTIWRVSVADHQAETVRRDLFRDRFQKGAEMLGSRILAVRLGGIDALQRLASEHAAAFLPQIVRLYCAFVWHRAECRDGEALGGECASATGSETSREDVRAVMNAMAGQRRLLSNQVGVDIYDPFSHIETLLLLGLARTRGAENRCRSA